MLPDPFTMQELLVYKGLDPANRFNPAAMKEVHRILKEAGYEQRVIKRGGKAVRAWSKNFKAKADVLKADMNEIRTKLADL